MMRKKKTSMLVSAAIMALIATAFFLPGLTDAGEMEPTAPPAPTMKTLDKIEPRIPISSLPYDISAPGSYYLTGELTGSVGVRVLTDNVTIDLMGYSLLGDSSNDGIWMYNRTNVEIRNGTIRGFNYGIYAGGTNSNHNRVKNVRVLDNGAQGIYLGSKNNLVKECTALNNGSVGIDVGGYSVVIGNTSSNNREFGIRANTGSVVNQNTASVNDRTGIAINSCCATVSNNTVVGNGEYGISAGSYSTVINNVARNSKLSGIKSGIASTLKGNTVTYSQNYGIELASFSLVDGNTTYDNNQSGGAYTNMNTCATCVFGINVAP